MKVKQGNSSSHDVKLRSRKEQIAVLRTDGKQDDWAREKLA
jgi:hypothetical protein